MCWRKRGRRSASTPDSRPPSVPTPFQVATPSPLEERLRGRGRLRLDCRSMRHFGQLEHIDRANTRRRRIAVATIIKPVVAGRDGTDNGERSKRETKTLQVVELHVEQSQTMTGFL